MDKKFVVVISFMIAIILICSSTVVISGNALKVSKSTGRPVRTIFVTSTLYDGNLGGLSGADAKCQERAKAGRLSGKWIAIISDSRTPAINRVPNAKYMRLDGKVIAKNKQDLFDGTILVPIRITEYGKDVKNYIIKSDNYASDYDAWTGSTEYGGSYVGNLITTTDPNRFCKDWTTNIESWSPYMDGRAGDSTYTNFEWINQLDWLCSRKNRLYCIRVQ